MLEIARQVRDRAFLIATALKTTTEVDGIRLSLRDTSPRMRYVMCCGYEAGDAKLAASILDSSDSVLEAGSAIGFMALYCIKRLGIRNYMMVEANPQLERSIIRNFAINSVPMAPLLIAGVAPTDGPLSFGVNRNFWSSSTVTRSGESRITVPGRSIPSLLAEMKFKPTTLIMDIEGGEASIPHEHFLPFRKIVIETHRKLVGDQPIDSLLTFLRSNGFTHAGKEGGSHAFIR